MIVDARLTLHLDKEQYFFGENVLLRCRLENTGDQVFEVATQSGRTRDEGIHVEALHESGAWAPDPQPYQFQPDTLGSVIQLAGGEHYWITIALHRYRRTFLPGAYEVTVRLSWGSSGLHIAPASVLLEMAEPTEDEARTVLDALDCQEPCPDYQGSPCFPCSDYTSLYHPLYLPLLRTRALDGDPRAVQCVTAIETPEATALLIQVLETPHAEAVRLARRELHSRVPQDDDELCFFGQPGVESRTKRLRRVAWAPELAAPLTAALVRILRAKSTERWWECEQLLAAVDRLPRR